MALAVGCALRARRSFGRPAVAVWAAVVALAVLADWPGVGAQSLSISCPATNYLNPSTLTCSACATNQAYNVDSEMCMCLAGYYLSGSSCLACSTGQTSSYDRTACVACPSGSSTAASGAVTCTCPTDNVFLDRDVNGTLLATGACSACPYSSYPSADLSTCITCDNLQYQAVYSAGNYSCQCPSPYVSAPQGQACLTTAQVATVQTAYSVTLAGTTTFTNFVSTSGAVSSVTVSSAYIRGLFVGAAALCTQTDTTQVKQCEVLGNLCVLQMYATSAPACAAYRKIAQLRGASSVAGNTDWPAQMPWLYYGLLNSQTSATVLAQPVNVYVTFSSSPESPQVNVIPLVLAAYSLNGTYLGLQPFSTTVDQCADNSASSDLTVGDNVAKTCSVDLASVLSTPAQTVLYDPYVVQADGSLYPVPVLISSTTAQSSQLVRRFPVFDTASASSTAPPGVSPTVVSYLASVQVVITKQADVSSKIMVPQLIVSYVQQDASQISATATGALATYSNPSFSFTSTYTMTYDTFWRVIIILFALVCMAAVLVWLYVAYRWNRRNYTPLETMDLPFIAHVLLTGAGSFAGFLTALLFGISLYWLIFYKGQTVVYVLIPTTSGGAELGSFLSVLAASYALQWAYVALTLYRQSSATFFFIDWERPRARLLQAPPTAMTTSPSSPTPLPQMLAAAAAAPEKGLGRLMPVSMWRTLRMVDEWRRLQTFRRISTGWTLFWMLFILVGLRVRYVATPQPSSSDLTPGATNPVLLFGMDCSVWLGLLLTQYLYRYVIYERYFCNALLQFVDMLSVANLSLIVFTDRFHGYYVHGRSVHGFADTDMATMNENLLKEENDQVPQRGLDGTTEQLYEVFVTQQFHEMYSKVNALVFSEEDRKQSRMLARLDGGAARAAGAHGRPAGSSAEAVRAYESVNRFLCGVIDKNFKDYLYNVRRRLFSEKYLSLFPDLTQGSIFYTETSPVFSDALLCGIEPHLQLLLLLTFTLVDCYADNAPLAALIVFLTDVVLGTVRSYFGQRNISRRTLIDGRFFSYA